MPLHALRFGDLPRHVRHAGRQAAHEIVGRQVVTGSRDKTVRVWEPGTQHTATQDLVDRAKIAVSRCLTQAQRQQFFLDPEPPDWCIEMEKWPYRTAAWRRWLAQRRTGRPVLPGSR
jgi:hypothetical protein